ncbi:MAG: radical SAM protein [Lachnospiraceae bacterium]|nr:radical SAM protein [Lachnospiraceae bacterium]
MEKKINEWKAQVLAGENLSREEILEMLAIDPESEICDKLGAAAFEVARQVSGDRAYLWGAFGVDYKPCSMNCDFCSLGEAWGIITTQKEFSMEEVIENVRYYAEHNVRWIVLRTTEFYSLDELGELIEKIRKEVPGVYEIGLNVGEFDEAKANQLYERGVQFIYHSLRMGEGKDTAFDPNVRKSTLSAIKNSPLKLVFLVEPIGIEHTNEEIADVCQLTIDYGAIVSGAMARVPVEGTPLGRYPQLSERRLAQIIAVVRLACGFQVKDICVHPANETAIRWGANVAVVETGSIPRDRCCFPQEKWNNFDIAQATEWFENQGYTVYNKGE